MKSVLFRVFSLILASLFVLNQLNAGCISGAINQGQYRARKVHVGSSLRTGKLPAVEVGMGPGEQIVEQPQVTVPVVELPNIDVTKIEIPSVEQTTGESSTEIILGDISTESYVDESTVPEAYKAKKSFLFSRISAFFTPKKGAVVLGALGLAAVLMFMVRQINSLKGNTPEREHTISGPTLLSRSGISTVSQGAEQDWSPTGSSDEAENSDHESVQEPLLRGQIPVGIRDQSVSETLGLYAPMNSADREESSTDEGSLPDSEELIAKAVKSFGQTNERGNRKSFLEGDYVGDESLPMRGGPSTSSPFTSQWSRNVSTIASNPASSSVIQPTAVAATSNDWRKSVQNSGSRRNIHRVPAEMGSMLPSSIPPSQSKRGRKLSVQSNSNLMWTLRKLPDFFRKLK